MRFTLLAALTAVSILQLPSITTATAADKHENSVISEHPPRVSSTSALIVDQKNGTTFYAKNPDEKMPIASITKLMTAMVVLDANPSLSEHLVIHNEDVDTLRNSSSRLRVGTRLSRRELLQLALMSSENRAASALAHAYPAGYQAFIAAMNRKARQIGMHNSTFVDATGLHSENAATAEDLSKMVVAAYQYDLIRKITTTGSYELATKKRVIGFKNTNALVRNKDWKIGLSKTGYINEAGHCLVMQVKVAQRPLIIVLLDSGGKRGRLADAIHLKHWIEQNMPSATAARVMRERPS